MRFALLIAISLILLSTITCDLTAQKGSVSQNILRKYKNCIYTVTTDGTSPSQGTGFCISADGMIVTNAHVLTSESVYLKHPTTGLRIKGEIRAIDREIDLAIVQIPVEDASHLDLDTRINLGSSDIGKDLVVIGSPLGLELSVSTGILSGIRHDGTKTIYQISAPISPGSSGSPVFDKNGHVIGVASSTLTGSQQLNFAIPIEYVAYIQNAKSIASGNLSEYPYNSMFTRITELRSALQPAPSIRDNLSDTYSVDYEITKDPQGLIGWSARGGMIINSDGDGVAGMLFTNGDTTTFPFEVTSLLDGRVILRFGILSAEGIQTDEGFFVWRDSPIASENDWAFYFYASRSQAPALNVSGLYSIKWQSSYISGSFSPSSITNWHGECAIFKHGDVFGMALTIHNDAGGSVFHFYRGRCSSLEDNTIFKGANNTNNGKIELRVSGGNISGTLEDYRDGGAKFYGKFYGKKMK